MRKKKTNNQVHAVVLSPSQITSILRFDRVQSNKYLLNLRELHSIAYYASSELLVWRRYVEIIQFIFQQNNQKQIAKKKAQNVWDHQVEKKAGCHLKRSITIGTDQVERENKLKKTEI